MSLSAKVFLECPFLCTGSRSRQASALFPSIVFKLRSNGREVTNHSIACYHSRLAVPSFPSRRSLHHLLEYPRRNILHRSGSQWMGGEIIYLASAASPTSIYLTYTSSAWRWSKPSGSNAKIRTALSSRGGGVAHFLISAKDRNSPPDGGRDDTLHVLPISLPLWTPGQV